MSREGLFVSITDSLKACPSCHAAIVADDRSVPSTFVDDAGHVYAYLLCARCIAVRFDDALTDDEERIPDAVRSTFGPMGLPRPIGGAEAADLFVSPSVHALFRDDDTEAEES